VSGLVLSGGFVGRTPLYMLRGDVPFRDMAAAEKKWVRKVGLYLFGRLFVQEYPWEETFFLDAARRVRAAVRLPLVLLGGIVSRPTVARAMAEGFELAGMARALLHDATLPRRLERGEVERRGCIPCNRCIAEMDRGGVRCVGALPRTSRADAATRCLAGRGALCQAAEERGVTDIDWGTSPWHTDPGLARAPLRSASRWRSSVRV
jgi:hypothetical protein